MKESQGIILAPLGALYGAVTGARRALYKTGALKVNKINAPVISIGNITTGGTGKTPLVEWVARIVAREGRRVSILTRGYARKNEGLLVVVSDGERILADARKGGDEPRLLAEALQGIASVISDADRTSAARYAIENFKSEVFILDDGFQHLRLARDLNIVAIDSTNPWGGGRLLPRGRLREPLRELRRADLIILTRTEQSQDIISLRKQAERLSNGRPIILSRTKTRLLRPLTATTERNTSESSTHHSSSFAAFCAIGNPSAFFKHLQSDGYTLKLTRSFPDHHVYTQTEVDEIVLEAKQAGAEVLMTTMKDAVKLRSLRFDLPCYVLEIELEFDDEEKLTAMIREAVAD
ncbi:MAG: tetraacyldisaccharide 4'-kinase [Acidobacteria bacterium]|nr:MAG: tetraacyldisaccharide 4'-kinase [Acidobacteriota bacterium]